MDQYHLRLIDLLWIANMEFRQRRGCTDPPAGDEATVAKRRRAITQERSNRAATQARKGFCHKRSLSPHVQGVTKALVNTINRGKLSHHSRKSTITKEAIRVPSERAAFVHLVEVYLAVNTAQAR